MMKPKFKLAAICALSALTACRTAQSGSVSCMQGRKRHLPSYSSNSW